MKRVLSSLILGLVMATGFALASPVEAQEVTRTITITRDSKLAGQSLSKGEYSIKFAEGKDGELILFKGKKELFKAPYTVTTLTQPAADNSVAYNASGDGSYQVKRLEFRGKTEAIVLD